MQSAASGGSPGLLTRILSDPCDIPPLALEISLFEGPNFGSPARFASRGVMTFVPEYPVSRMLDGCSCSFQLSAIALVMSMIVSFWVAARCARMIVDACIYTFPLFSLGRASEIGHCLTRRLDAATFFSHVDTSLAVGFRSGLSKLLFASLPVLCFQTAILCKHMGRELLLSA